MTDQLSALRDAFSTCDRDGDHRLNETEFLHFCDVGLHKPQATSDMYVQMCAQLQVDPAAGVRWDDINNMFSRVNTQPPPSNPTSSKPTLTSPSSNIDIHQRTNSMSSYNSQDDIYRSGSIPRRDPSFHGRTASVASDDDLSQTSEGGRSSLGFHSRTQSSMAELELIKALQGNNEETHKKLSKKIRKLNKKVSSLEKDKKSAQEENHQLRTRINELENQVTRLEHAKSDAIEQSQRFEKERNLLIQHEREQEAQIRQQQTEHETESQQIQTLETQRNEVLLLFKQAEAQFGSKLSEVKQRHKEQMERLALEFVQSIGAQPGDDVRIMVQELRDERQSLQDQVDMLAEQLTRKDRSLYEALRAIDALSTQHKQTASVADAGASNHSRGRSSLLSRRFSLRNVAQFAQQYRRAQTNTAGNVVEQEDEPEISPRHSGSETDLTRQESLPSALGTISARRNNLHRPLTTAGNATARNPQPAAPGTKNQTTTVGGG